MRVFTDAVSTRGAVWPFPPLHLPHRRIRHPTP